VQEMTRQLNVTSRIHRSNPNNARLEVSKAVKIQVEVTSFHPEDGGSMILRKFISYETASQPRRPRLENLNEVVPCLY